MIDEEELTGEELEKYMDEITEIRKRMNEDQEFERLRAECKAANEEFYNEQRQFDEPRSFLHKQSPTHLWWQCLEEENPNSVTDLMSDQKGTEYIFECRKCGVWVSVVKPKNGGYEMPQVPTCNEAIIQAIIE